MWVEIKKEIFEKGAGSDLIKLILDLIYNPVDSVVRYNIYINLDKVENLNGFKKLPDSIQGILREEYIAFHMGSNNIKFTITENNARPDHFNVEEGIRFFNKPVLVILENNKNDAHFIRSILHHFSIKNGHGLQTLVEHMNNGWLDFDNAGGCGNVKNFIEGKLVQFERLAAKNGKSTHDYFRCFVFLDSDREFPAQALKPDYTSLQGYLATIGTDNFHILEKRMMENYMPDEVIHDLPKTFRSWVAVYKTLNNLQKDHLNYPVGFSKDGNPPSQEVLNLYPLPKSDFDILDIGLKYPSFKTNFPLLFSNSTRVNKQSLSNRAGSNELEEIISKLSACI